MAKKALKKQVPTSKTMKTAKPAAKTAVKKTVPAKKAAAMKPAKAASPVKAKVAVKASAKMAVVATKAKDVKRSTKPVPVKAVAEKSVKAKASSKVSGKISKVVNKKATQNKELGLVDEENSKVNPAKPEKDLVLSTKKTKISKKVTDDVEVPKKEKKVKFDRAGMSEDQVKWNELRLKHEDDKPAMYTISGVFEAKTPITHKIFGLGFVLTNEYDRLEVLFEDGKRMLISNRKL